MKSVLLRIKRQSTLSFQVMSKDLNLSIFPTLFIYNAALGLKHTFEPHRGLLPYQ